MRLTEQAAEALDDDSRHPANVDVADQLSTLSPLRGELETLALALRQPGPRDAVLDEVGCARAVELAWRVVGDGEEPVTWTHSITVANEPQQIGPYQLLERIGQGGMGAVYRALHPSLGKVVALKVLAANRHGDPLVRERFQREMKAVGKLDHPHLIRAFDAGEADGAQYLAMEFVSGIDLAVVLKQCGPLSVADACELITQAAQGLHAAHARGMVHRDIKPANLMLAWSEFGPPLVKVLDLGLALFSESHAVDQRGLTSDGQIMGTIDFMAPEQADNSHAVDLRADVYSLGATLFALLTGGSIFADRPGRSMLQKLAVLAHEPAPSVSSRRSDLDPELVRVVDRMLARDPQRRFASMVEVIDALKPFVCGGDLAALLRIEVGGRPQGPTAIAATMLLSETQMSARSRDPGRRRRWGLGLAGGVVGTAIAAMSLVPPTTPLGHLEFELSAELSPDLLQDLQLQIQGDARRTLATAELGWQFDLPSGRYELWRAKGDERIQLAEPQVQIEPGQRTVVRLNLAAPPSELRREFSAAESHSTNPASAQQSLSATSAVTPDGVEVELLASVDLARDVARGEWSRDGADLTVNQVSVNHTLCLPARGGDAYSLRCNFTVDRGNVALTLPIGGTFAELGALGNKLALKLNGGKWGEGVVGPQLPFTINDGRRHELVVEVALLESAQMHLTATVDGELALQRQGALADLKLSRKAPSCDGCPAINVFLTNPTTARVHAVHLMSGRAHLKSLRGEPLGSRPQAASNSVVEDWEAHVRFAQWLKSFEPPMSFEIRLADGKAKSVPVTHPMPDGPFRVQIVMLKGLTVDHQGDEFVDEFAQRVRGVRLNGLEIQSDRLTIEGLEKLLRLPELADVEWFEIRSPLLPDDALSLLARLKRLQCLGLRCPQMTGRGLGHLQTLKHLSLYDGTNCGLEALRELQRLPTFNGLHAYDLRLGEAEIAELTKLRLTNLRVERAGLNDAMFARLVEMPSLEVLAISRERITDDGLEALSKSTKLQQLGLLWTETTEDGVARLRQALPGCQIEWRPQEK